MSLVILVDEIPVRTHNGLTLAAMQLFATIRRKKF